MGEWEDRLPFYESYNAKTTLEAMYMAKTEIQNGQERVLAVHYTNSHAILFLHVLCNLLILSSNWARSHVCIKNLVYRLLWNSNSQPKYRFFFTYAEVIRRPKMLVHILTKLVMSGVKMWIDLVTSKDFVTF